MNLLYFTHEKEYGGSSRALISLLEKLKDNNTIYVVVPFKNAKIIPELKKMNVKIIHCFYSWWQVPVNTSKLKKILFKLAYIYNIIPKIILDKKIKKLEIDIIHSNTSVIDIGAKIANKLKIQHVWHFREFTKNNLEYIKGSKRSYSYINNFGGNIIYISKAIEQFYFKNIKNNKTKVIYDGLSKDIVIYDKEYKEKYDNIKFLLAGTLQENKGQKLAVEAVYKLKSKGYKNMKLYLAGGDPVGYGDYLDSIIDKYDLKNYVEKLGFVQNMKEVRKNVDVELLCSDSEAFGLVTVEGMLAGNLLIGSNSGATSEIIKDEETGYLYKCKDSEDLAKKMEKIITNPKVIKEIGIKAQKYAIEEFSNDRSAKEISNMYEEIIKG
jgi:glycosyltransferase involved in cell wall biosynthesis